jgi:hypothetical protein
LLQIELAGSHDEHTPLAGVELTGWAMRLKSEIWIKAYLRRAAIAGSAGVVVRRGDDEAGAIFIKIDKLDGYGWLYGPAPAGFDGNDQERRFMPLLKGVATPQAEIDAALAREIRFDSDVWIIEIESREGTHFLDGWLLATPA